jgi:hypothetical protein
MEKESLMQIVKEHNLTIIDSHDIENAIYFVADILRAEADYIESTEPYATNAIKRYRQAAFTVEHELDRDELIDMFEEEKQ